MFLVIVMSSSPYSSSWHTRNSNPHFHLNLNLNLNLNPHRHATNVPRILLIVLTLALTLAQLTTRATATPPANDLSNLLSQRRNALTLNPSLRYKETRRLRWLPKLLTNRWLLRAESSESQTPQGYTFDPCRFHKDCTGKRLCISGNFEYSCSGAEQCFCFIEYLQICGDCDDCEFRHAETCVKSPDDDDQQGYCASNYTVYEGIFDEVGCDSYPDRTPTPVAEDKPEDEDSPSRLNASVPIPKPQPDTSADNDKDDGDDGEDDKADKPSSSQNSSAGSENQKSAPSDACIDAALLSHLPATQHVFREHRTARVLCDHSGSCATPGHMVVFQGVPMSMRAYCGRLAHACASRVMQVNSPKFSRTLRIASRSAGLQFTALAARFETALEERALAFAIRIGF